MYKKKFGICLLDFPPFILGHAHCCYMSKQINEGEKWLAAQPVIGISLMQFSQSWADPEISKGGESWDSSK